MLSEEEHLLTILGEECAEVSHRISKALRFGLLETQPGQLLTNEARMVQELQDLVAVAWLLLDRNVIHGDIFDRDACDAKRAKVLKYLAYSDSLGLVAKDADA